MALKKTKKKITSRKDRVSIDQKMMGPEPLFTEEDNTLGEQPDGKVGSMWATASRWYGYYYDNKHYCPYAYEWLENQLGWDEDKIKIFARVPDYKTRTIGNVGVIQSRGYVYCPELIEKYTILANELYEEGLLIGEIKQEAAKEKPVLPTIQERTKTKVMETIYTDWDNQVIEQWVYGNYKVTFDCFTEWKRHGLKGNAIPMFKDLIDLDYEVLKDAYDNNCDQAKEAYAHITKANKKKMLNVYDTLYLDLSKLQDSFKATRKTRVRVPRTMDQQVSKLNYMPESLEAKLTSINPVHIPTKNKLWVYNTKQGKLAEYVCDSASGFEIKGSTIQNFNPKLSKITKLRKPDDILPQILNKTELQIAKVWKGLTTTIYEPTGRINNDCILMRVI